MTGNVSINLSLANIWESWQKFRVGKKPSPEIEYFSYNLEQNLFKVYAELSKGSYQHSSYRKFFVTDNKRREISVAQVKDRVVHRLVYEYLLPIDKSFDFDAWSCRRHKGLIAAIERAQNKAKRYKNHFVWRADIKKFFDNVDQIKLMQLIDNKISDPKALRLIEKIIKSYSVTSAQKNGDLTLTTAGRNSRERERERE
jgi:retron-type reverse transcriptase